MPKENDEEKNHFLALVEQFGDVIEERHLEMLLKSEIDLISKVYTWVLTVFIGIAGAASAFNVVIDPSSILGWLPLIAVVSLILVVWFLARHIKRIDPLKLKGRLLQDFLIAKRRLAEKKKLESSNGDSS